MARFIQFFSGSLLLAAILSLAFLNASFAVNWDFRVVWYHLSNEGLIIPFGPWCGLTVSILAGAFLFSSISPKR